MSLPRDARHKVARWAAEWLRYERRGSSIEARREAVRVSLQHFYGGYATSMRLEVAPIAKLVLRYV